MVGRGCIIRLADVLKSVRSNLIKTVFSYGDCTRNKILPAQHYETEDEFDFGTGLLKSTVFKRDAHSVEDAEIYLSD